MEERTLKIDLIDVQQLVQLLERHSDVKDLILHLPAGLKEYL